MRPIPHIPIPTPMSNTHVGHPRPASVPPLKIGNDPRYRLRHVERAIAGCPDRYFVTLTMKKRVDEHRFSDEVFKTMHRVNTALFGNHYRRGQRMRLATMAVQERTLNDGLHTHVLVGVPERSLSLKTNPCRIAVPDLIVQTWVQGDPQYRRSIAQDARDVYEFSGNRSYICKRLKTLDDFDNFDVFNTFIP